MGLTRFPNGVSSFGIPQMGSGTIPTTTGSYFFVSSGTGSDSNAGKEIEKPLATLDAAIGKCTASKMDVIVLMPGHSETVSGAGAITMDVAGVQIVGLGTGTLRPSFSFTATASSILVTAANVSISNCVFSSGIAELVTCFTISGTGFTMDNCAVVPTATSMINFITTTATADYLTIQNCRFDTTAIPTANDYFIVLVGGDYCTIRNNFFAVLTSDNAGSGSIQSKTTKTTNMLMAENYIYSIGTAVIAIRLLTASTGLMWNNQIGGTKTDADNVVIADAVYKFNNLTTNNADASGFVAPVIDTAG
jgi:hypothetical protein